MRVSKALLAVLGLFIICSGGLYAASNNHRLPINKVFVFGDSLSDNGNFYEFTSGAVPITPPYFEGRFANNLTWTEYLADKLNLDAGNQRQFSNYAYALTWAIDVDEMPPDAAGLMGIAYEIEQFLENESNHGQDNKNQLFLFWIGANDYLDGRMQEKIKDVTNKTIAAIEKHLNTLLYDGAHHVMILNLPDLSLAPSVRARGEEVVKNVKKLTEMHNKKLKALVDRLKKLHPEKNIMRFDVTKHLNDVLTNPEKYHFSNLTDPCYIGEYASLHENPNDDSDDDNPEDFYCNNPDSYLYWDKTHPSSAVHRYLAEFAHKFLEEHVPAQG